MGINVSSKEGENLGQVQDLVLNPKTGKIRFALIGQGFMAGTTQKMIPVPWKAVNVRAQQEFALNVDKNKLKAAPGWSQTEYEHPDYVIRVYRFYEIEPEPQTDIGGPGELGQEQGTGQGSSTEPEDSNQNSRKIAIPQLTAIPQRRPNKGLLWLGARHPAGESNPKVSCDTPTETPAGLILITRTLPGTFPKNGPFRTTSDA